MPLDRDALQTTAVLDAVSAALGDAVVAVYRHGSAVLGGLRPHSDLDLLVVVDRPTAHEERRALVHELLEISGDTSPRPVELTVVRDASLHPWRYPPEREFQFREWLRDDYAAGSIPAPVRDPDLVLLITVARSSGPALIGPPPVHVLPAVPWKHVVAAMLAGMPDLLREADDDTVNVLLTLSRIWHTLATGQIVAKDEAAAWVLQRLASEHQPTLAHARAVYRGEVLPERPVNDGTGRSADGGAGRRCAQVLARRIHDLSGTAGHSGSTG